MDALIILAFMGIGAIVFVAGVLKMVAQFRGHIEAVGGLEGLKALQQRMMEAQPAAALPVVTPVGRVQTTRWVWLFFALSALLSFGLGGFFQYRALRSARLLENEGVIMRATITQMHISEDDDGDETYYLTYSFATQSPDAGSRQVKRKESVPFAVFLQAEEGGGIEILYARSDPKVARIVANYEPGKVSYLPIILGGIFGLVDAILTVPFYRRFRDAMRLDVEGTLTTAAVLDLFETSDESNTAYYVAYTLPDGQKIRHGVKASIYKQLHVGDLIQLVYLPDNPKIFRPDWAHLAI
jgi:hypothetical protein